jgi:hypothetical protein
MYIMRDAKRHGENSLSALLNPFLSHRLLRIFFLPISLGAAALLVNVPAPAHTVCVRTLRAEHQLCVVASRCHLSVRQTVLRLFNAGSFSCESAELMQAPGVCS